MDILDEIDAKLAEKKNSWSYTPKRERSETDAIIDDLLREFSPEENKKPARKYTPEPRYYEEESFVNEEVAERIEYERATASDTPNFDIPPAAEENLIPQDLDDSEFDDYDEYGGEEYTADDEYEDDSYEVYPDNNYVPQDFSDNNEDEEYIPDGNFEEVYNDEAYDDEEYDDEEYDDSAYDDEEYDADYDDYEDYDESGNSGNNNGDAFENFMDSEDESQSGDIPKNWVSGILKTILKIALLAGFLALAVFGALNAIDVLKEKYGTEETVSESDPLKTELQNVIMPLVVIDIEDFDDKTKLKSEDYINTAVWDFIINGNKSAYTDSETGECHLPEQEIETIIAKLYGDVEFKHCSAGTGNVEIKYDKRNGEYIIPDNSDLYSFRPVVTDISDTNPVYIVYADCYVSSPSWQESDKKHAQKRLMITLEKTADYYNIVSQKTIPVE